MSDIPNLSGKVGLDITDFKAGIAQLNRDIRVVESGFRASAAGLGDWGKSADGLRMRISSLTKEMDLQEKKVKLLREEYTKIVKEKGEDSRAAQELLIKLNKETEVLGKEKTELSETRTNLKNMGDASKTAGDDVDKLDKEQVKAKTSGDQWHGTVEKLGSALKTMSAVALGVVGAVAAIGTAIGGLVLHAAASADQLDEMSTKTGVSIEKLQELQYIGKIIGVDLDTMTGAMARLVRSMNSVGTNKSMSAAFKELGVSATDSSGNLRDSRVVFDDVITALGKIPDETERDALSMTIFGKSAQELNPLITAGADELARLTDEAHKNGAIMSTENVKALGAFQDKLDGMKMGLQGVLGTLASAFLPGFSNFVNLFQGYLQQFSGIVSGSNGDLTKMASGLGGLLGQIIADISAKGPQLLQAGLGIIQGIIDAIMKNLPQLIPAAISMITTLVQFIMQNLPIIINAGMQLILALVQGIVPQLPLLLEAGLSMIFTLLTGVIQALPQIITTITQIIPQMISILVENLPLLIIAGIQLLVALIEGIAQALPQIIPAVVGIIPVIIETLLQNLPLLVEAALNLIMALAQGLIAAIPVLIPEIPKIVQAIVDTVTTCLPLVINCAITLITTIMEALINNLPMIVTAALAIINALLSGIVTNLPIIVTGAIQIITALVTEIIALIPSLIDAGKQLVEGIWKGLQDAWEGLKKDFSGLIAGLPDWVKKILKISSPSEVFAGIGKNIALGLGKGFSDQFRDIQDQVMNAIGGMSGMEISANVNTGFGGRQMQPALAPVQIIIQGVPEKPMDAYRLARNVATEIQRRQK